MVTTHIWICLEKPKNYWSMDIDELGEPFPGLFDFMAKQVNEMSMADHTHIFGERSSPKGYNVFHECPGRVALTDIAQQFIKIGSQL